MEFEFQTDRNYYVDLRQMYLALKPKLVRSCDYETCNNKETKKEHKEKTKFEEEQTAQEAPVPPVNNVSNILNSIISNVEVYINNQKIYNSNGLHALKPYISYNFKGAISEYKEFCNARGTTLKNFLMNFLKRLCLNFFFTRRMKLLSRPDGFLLYG